MFSKLVVDYNSLHHLRRRTSPGRTFLLADCLLEPTCSYPSRSSSCALQRLRPIFKTVHDDPDLGKQCTANSPLLIFFSRYCLSLRVRETQVFHRISTPTVYIRAWAVGLRWWGEVAFLSPKFTRLRNLSTFSPKYNEQTSRA